jgi:hypothetical protein
MPWKVTVAFNPGVSVVHTSFPGPQPGRRRSAESGRRCTSRAPLRFPVGRGTLVGAGHQAAQWDNFCAGFLIEAHDGGASSVEVSEHADTAAKADALAHPKWAFRTAAQGVHLVGRMPPLIWVEASGRPILSVALRNRHGDRRYRRRRREADGSCHGRRSDRCSDGDRRRDRYGRRRDRRCRQRTVGDTGVEGKSEATTPAVEERLDAGFASPVEPGVDAGVTLRVELSLVFD